jgi:protein KTI12
MPLIIITGYPCCGKTTFSNKLGEYFQQQFLLEDGVDNNKKSKNVIIINEESECIKKREGYKNSFNEKLSRAALKSAVDHALKADCTVIVDSLNYIKGYRYELYCIARSLRTPHCVAWVECDDIISWQWNIERSINDIDNSYEELIMSDLRLRFEGPLEKNRWDNPLFRINCTPLIENSLNSDNKDEKNKIETINKIEASLDNIYIKDKIVVEKEQEENKTVFTSWRKKKVSNQPSSPSVISKMTISSTNIDLDNNNGGGGRKAIWWSGTNNIETKKEGVDSSIAIVNIYNYLNNALPPPVNVATLPVPRVNADHLYELDQVSKKISDRIIAHQNECQLEGTPLLFVDYDRTLTVNRRVSVAELQVC